MDATMKSEEVMQPCAVERLTAAVERLAGLVEKLGRVMDKRVLTIDEAAAYTGLTKRTLRDMVRGREIEYAIMRGNEVAFEKSALEAYMLRLKVPSRDEAETWEADAYVMGRTAAQVTRLGRAKRKRAAGVAALAAMDAIAGQITAKAVKGGPHV